MNTQGVSFTLKTVKDVIRDELDTLTSSEGIKGSVGSRVQSLNLVSESGLYDLSCSPESRKQKHLNGGSLTKYCRPSAKQIENWSKMPKKTLWRWLEKLEKARRIQSGQDFNQIKIADNNGRGHETTIYNLNVLNQLAMACIDNEKLNEVSCKFSDMLSELEECERIPRCSDLNNVDIPTETGSVKTTIYMTIPA